MAISRLIVAPNWIGDTVMSLPALRAIRSAHPQDTISVLAPRGPGTLLRADPAVDRVLVREGLVRDAVRLRRARFDEAWILPNSFRSAIAPFLAGIPVRIGYATDRRSALLTHSVARPPATAHQLGDYDRLLASRGIRGACGAPVLSPPARARERARAELEAVGIADERLALLAPASAVSATKRWPADRFAGLADRLRELGFSAALVIGPNEDEIAARVQACVRHPIPALGSNLDPLELAGLLECARIVIANDSGPMHLAAAVGTPVVALFGPTDPGRTAPIGAKVRVLDRYLFCSPCFLDRCPYGHECMKEISVEDVLRAMEELLGTGTVSR